MRVLPNTSTKGAGRRWPLYALAIAALVALSLGVETFLRAENFLPGKEIVSPGIRDITVSTKDNLYPPPDTSYFEDQPEAVFVYLSVEDLPSGEAMEARVERAGSGSAFSLLFGPGAGLEILNEDNNLSKGENGSTGIVKFALKTNSGKPVPPGNYTVDVYGPRAAEGEDNSVAARKSFAVQG
jgi:hypothetical protein